MNNKEYQKTYKQEYKSKNKIITFPLSNPFYNELNRRALIVDLKVNSYAKNIITSFLNNTHTKELTIKQQEFIKEYIHISRGIANNINQIAYNSNAGIYIDINILIKALKSYEEEFKKFISKA